MTDLDAIILVDRWFSLCSACDRDCDPYEDCHDTLLGYGAQNGQPGCGARFVAIKANTSLTGDPRQEYRILHQMRPDLEVIGG